MKTSVFCIVSVFLLACCLTALGQGYSLHWKTNRIGVAFDDSTLGDVAKGTIVSDLQYCISGWGANAEIVMRSQGTSVGYMSYGRANPYYCEEIEFPENIVNDYATSGLALQISKKLSDAYTNAFAFVAANANIVTAAYEFVSFVSSSNFVSISSNAVPNFVLFKNEWVTSNDIVALGPQIITDISRRSYFKPSALGFYYSEDGPSPTNLWMWVPCASIPAHSASPRWSSFPAVWHEGKWKFCIWKDWVP